MAFALAQKFEVINNNSLAASQIIAVTRCPELYGKEFFKKGNYYKAIITTYSIDTVDYSVLSNYKESKLPTYWIERLEKSH
jgi:hypothetical protein